MVRHPLQGVSCCPWLQRSAIGHLGSPEGGDSVELRMDPQPPPLSGWPPPLPPGYDTPPAPPAWSATTTPEASSPAHVVRWILAAGTLLAVASVMIVAVHGWHPAVSAPIPAGKQTASPTTSASAPNSASPSATPVSAAVAEAERQYLAVVAPVNADGDRLHAALVADESLPCTCSPGEFEVRADSLAVIPSINRDTEAMQVMLQTIKHEVPAVASDVDTVVLDNQQYTGYLAAAYRASQARNGAVGYYMNEAEAVDQASRSDFGRLRSDLGLPPPPGS